MPARALSVAALAILGAAAAAWWLARDASEPAAAPVRGAEPAAPLAGAPGAASAAAELAEQRLAELDARVAALERELAELRARRAVEVAAPEPQPADPAVGLPPEGPLGEQRQAAIDDLRAITLDPARPARDRVVAAGELWRLDREAGTRGARTPEVVDALVEIAEGERDPEIRRLACFHALDATEGVHVPALLRMLARDESAEVRAQAADTLQSHLDDPAVRAALESSASGDAAESVRAAAAEILSRGSP